MYSRCPTRPPGATGPFRSGLLIIAGIHVASYVGQRLGADQMGELRGRLESVLSRQFESVSEADPERPNGR